MSCPPHDKYCYLEDDAYRYYACRNCSWTGQEPKR